MYLGYLPSPIHPLPHPPQAWTKHAETKVFRWIPFGFHLGPSGSNSGPLPGIVQLGVPRGLRFEVSIKVNIYMYIYIYIQNY